MVWLSWVSLASAYELDGYAWPEEQLPLELHWTGTLEGLTHDELRAAVEGAAAAWTDAAPCSFGIVAVEDPDADAWFDAGGVAVLYGDPDDMLDGGVLMVTISYGGSGETFTSNGTTFEAAPPSEIVVNDHAFWASDEDCPAPTSLQRMLTHELGHVIGLAHSCDEGEPCPDPNAPDAIMYWTTDQCDTELGPDDVAGVEAIYGPAFAWSFRCTISPDDALTADCAITSPADAEALGVTWDFGDGGAREGSSASYTYAEGGTYEIEVCVQPPDCDDRRCQTLTFVARSAADDTGPAIDTEAATASGGCGCATRGSAAWALAGLVGLVTTRRRGLRSGERAGRG